MANHTDAACEACRFYDDHVVNGGKAASDEGLCRFNPPISQPEPTGHGLWPVVASSDWCGHFKAEGAVPAE